MGEVQDGTVSVALRLHEMLAILTAVWPGEGLKAIRWHVATGIATCWTGDSALAHGAQELRLIRMKLAPIDLRMEIVVSNGFSSSPSYIHLIHWKVKITEGAEEEVALAP